jgi:Putative transmembrane protein (PGPGW)
LPNTDLGLVICNQEEDRQRVVGSLLKCGPSPRLNRSAMPRSCDNADPADQTKSSSRSLTCSPEDDPHTNTLTRPFKRIATLDLGWFLVLGGIISLFLPILPGSLLIVAGALMLSPQCAWPRRALEKNRARSHVLGRVVDWLCMLWTKADEARLAVVMTIRTHILGIR